MTWLGRTPQEVQERLRGVPYEIRYVHTPWIQSGVWRIVKEEKKDNAVYLTACLFRELDAAACVCKND